MFIPFFNLPSYMSVPTILPVFSNASDHVPHLNQSNKTRCPKTELYNICTSLSRFAHHLFRSSSFFSFFSLKFMQIHFHLHPRVHSTVPVFHRFIFIFRERNLVFYRCKSQIGLISPPLSLSLPNPICRPRKKVRWAKNLIGHEWYNIHLYHFYLPFPRIFFEECIRFCRKKRMQPNDCSKKPIDRILNSYPSLFHMYLSFFFHTFFEIIFEHSLCLFI